MNNSKRHILVTGPHRSGTTWIGKTLAQSENVELVYEPFNPDFERYNFTYKFDNWFEHVPTSKKYTEIETYFDRYIPNSSFKHAIKICRETGTSAKTPLIFIKKMVFSHRRPRYLLKDPIALMSAGWLYKRYHLNVICMTRKPLAFVGSLKEQGWDFDFRNLLNQTEFIDAYLPQYRGAIQAAIEKSDFTERAALLWNVLNTMILHYRDIYPEWFFTTHEEVVSDPVRKFREMYEYASLRFTTEVKEYIEAFTSAANPVEAESNRYQPRDAEKTTESWRDRLTESETEKVKKVTQDVYSRIYPEE